MNFLGLCRGSLSAGQRANHSLVSSYWSVDVGAKPVKEYMRSMTVREGLHALHDGAG